MSSSSKLALRMSALLVECGTCSLEDSYCCRELFSWSNSYFAAGIARLLLSAMLLFCIWSAIGFWKMPWFLLVLAMMLLCCSWTATFNCASIAFCINSNCSSFFCCCLMLSTRLPMLSLFILLSRANPYRNLFTFLCIRLFLHFGCSMSNSLKSHSGKLWCGYC